LRIDNSSADRKEDLANINFSGNQGNIRVYQEIDEFPRNEKNDYFPNQILRYVVSGNTSAKIPISTPEYLTNKSEMIYESGLTADAVTVNYFLPDEGKEQLKASTYKGRINYRIDSVQGEKILPLEIEININPFFELSLNMISGSVHFSHLIPNEPPQFKEVEIVVKSNLAKPYMVIQKLADSLRNSSGEKIDDKFFTFKEENESGESGKISQVDFTPVTVGEQPIFVSDSQGSSTKFKMIFRLQPYGGMAPGDYSTTVEYSLIEI